MGPDVEVFVGIRDVSPYLPHHQQGDHAEDDGAGERCQRTDLAGTEAIAPVVGVAAGMAIGEGGDAGG